MDRRNHFSLVQGWASAEAKRKFDQEQHSVTFKNKVYALGGTVGGCPWDELHATFTPFQPSPAAGGSQGVPVWAIVAMAVEGAVLVGLVAYLVMSKKKSDRLTRSLM